MISRCKSAFKKNLKLTTALTTALFAPHLSAANDCSELSNRIYSATVTLPKNIAFTTDNNPSDISHYDSALLRAITIAPKNDGNIFLTWSDTEGSAHLSKVNPGNGVLISDQNLGGIVIRDMIAVEDGVAILYFAGSSFGVRRIDAAGKTIFDSHGQMVGTFSQMWHLGALSLQGDRIAVYFGVSGNQGWNTGHEGDAFKIISSKDGRVIDGGWDWGCSHSIDTRITWGQTKPVRLCLSDVYPNPGFNIDAGYSILPTWGTHDGRSGGRIGGFINMGDSVYFAFNRSAGYGYAESTEVMQLKNIAPFTKVEHFGLGTAEKKSMKLAKLARLGTNELLTGWVYQDEKATVIQQLRSDLRVKSTPTRIEGSLLLPHSDFQTTASGDVVWVAKDAKSGASNKLLLQQVQACRSL